MNEGGPNGVELSEEDIETRISASQSIEELFRALDFIREVKDSTGTTRGAESLKGRANEAREYALKHRFITGAQLAKLGITSRYGLRTKILGLIQKEIGLANQ